MWIALLGHPHMVWISALVAIVLTLPSLWGGLVGDDFHHKLLMKGDMQGPAGIVRLMNKPWDMFRFFDHDPTRLLRLRDYGAVPWWTDEHIRGAFWRPIASLTHWADYRLWPHYPALMHAQSVLWYALAVGLTALFYRRLMGGEPHPTWASGEQGPCSHDLQLAAGLAALLYAVDYTHGLPVGFLANRSDLPAVAFGVLCLLVHDRWRRGGWRAGAALGPALLALSLLCKEAGIATCAYLAAYEAFLMDGPWRRRVGALVGYALVVVVWRACWTWLGYGVSGLGLYIDPLRQFGLYVTALPERFVVLLLGLWGLPPSEAVLVLGPRGRLWLAVWAVVFLLVLARLLWPLVRRDRLARFWTAGMLLSVLPACATFMSGRLLMFAGIGAMGLLAQWLTRIGPGLRPAACDLRNEPASRPQAPSLKPPARSDRLARGMAVAMVGIHLVLSPLFLMVAARWPAGDERLRSALYLTEPMDARIREQDLVFVNPPAAFAILNGLLAWAGEDAPMPRHVRVLVSAHFRPVEVYRSDERTLVVRPEAGYLHGILDVLFRERWRPYAVGDEVILTGMTVRITDIGPDGQPTEAAFQFAVPLEDPSLRWLYWCDGSFLPFKLPAVGQRVKLGSPRAWWMLP